MSAKTRFAVLCLFFLLAAAYSVPARAVLAGGLRQISALSTTSGGSSCANGAVVMKAVNIGGLTAAGARLSGGSLSLTAGVTPAVVTFLAAKSDLGTAHCYPVPFKPSAGHTKIIFTNLTRSVSIRIYTISGELVRTLSKSDTGDSLDWDARNMRGSAVDSGVYLYIIEGTFQSKKGKLMIIR
ncbi:MAG TPA: hypothetical protein DCS63_01230 [Elusimicrobia bacterium]|nr:hypothetical protein [Elusimicrobiota bacterium]